MSSMDSMRLQGLIRMIRQCKTTEEERASVKIASAQLRKGFEEATPYIRVRYMLMLLYIRMLGYPTEFGHMEVLKLLSQTDFSGVRTGYLALQLLFSEGDEVLTLVENRMIAHLSISGARRGVSYEQLCLVGVSLNAVANIASEDMCRDLLDSILRVFKNSPVQLRNKAALAALRVVRKAPDQAGYILEQCTDLFDASTDTLMCVLALVIECLQMETGAAMLGQFRRLAVSAVRALKGLVLSSRITDEDVGGITDPFLQIKLLHFMRVIGTGSEATSEALNDVLAQVITNTDATRNVGSAVLYECVRTINAIESDEGLRTLAVNTISRFLSSVKDNNLRFVALETLLTYASKDFDAVVQHQTVILECLRDPDLTIRRRALDLTVTLITVSNVRLLVPDLITYMTLCAEEMKGDVAQHICDVIEGHYPTDEWRVDFSIRLLKVAKQFAPMDFARRLIAVMSNQTDEIKTRAVQSLWEEASYPFDALHQSRKAFLMVALWCIGEYVDLLLGSVKGLKGGDVATCLSDLTTNTNYTVIKQYGLTALMKVAAKCPDAKEQALATFASNMTSMDCELQQRACEYTTLLSDFPEESVFSFSRMPAIRPETDAVKPVEVVSLTQEQLHQETASTLDDLFNFEGASKPPPSSVDTASQPPASPLQFGSTGSTNSSPLQPQQEQEKQASGSANTLGDIFGGSAGSASGSPLMGGSPADPVSPKAGANTVSGVPVCTCADFKVLLSARMEGTHITADLVVQSNLSALIEELIFSVAVLRICTVEVAPLPSTLLPFGTATQHLVVDNTQNTAHPRTLTLRVKVSYAVNGEPREQRFQVAQEM
ncbi:putative adaptor gamma-1 chain [Leptomonas pyrrhocoris]|uniref:AP-1 complex subunit gamma n=1 Tax=Leptomonas pyrrhocoris TaxID=157538 RepID=A0A0N0VG42_LEPPY|nr:putative adaptor gamma-1 chain [Leptomonas pyrrhocoris]KPA82521.1 putative adaptor gamma-1 chain [Leptomonas pyrrhocoris]|eukprot:XP_015660960.1 putative adaptor gamma-1 chain [Leptomonas pyrrhocoris]